VTSIFPACKSKHHPFWAALRACGLNICAQWVDWGPNKTGETPTVEMWREHWRVDLEQAAAADIVLAYCRADENQNGAFLEIGAALGSGKRVYLVAPDFDWSWRHHPRVTSFPTLDAAIAALREKDLTAR
jgi:hypothetical protein